MSAECKINSKTVKWTLDSKFVNDLKRYIATGKTEVSGNIIFKDTNNCINGICDKKSTPKYTIHKGQNDSVMTPTGLINFHTHPKSIYVSEETKYGWPSGEDMSQVIQFAKLNTIRHIVFTVEGGYIIKVNKKVSVYHSKMIENVLRYTHIYRSLDQNVQIKNFRKDFRVSGGTTVEMWLNLVNNLTLNKLYKYYNLFNPTKRKIPTNKKAHETIFTVQLKKLSNKFTFEANHINEDCHFTLYGLTPE
tara:strand:+ start:1882 stop:2625 length:744 start_codon:yes stop_codon:yes gene_type:complete